MDNNNEHQNNTNEQPTVNNFTENTSPKSTPTPEPPNQEPTTSESPVEPAAEPKAPEATGGEEIMSGPKETSGGGLLDKIKGMLGLG